MEEKATTKRKTVAGKILRVAFKTTLIIVLIVAAIALLILTPPVQNVLRKKATAWLTNKLQTKVEIGKIYIGFPKKIVLENIYIEDKKKDTLLAGELLKVDISMLKLLNNTVEVNQVLLEGITAKVDRVLPDTVYNFQFIIDAFATADTTTKQTSDSAAMDISLNDIQLDKIRLVYDDEVTGNDVTLWLEHFDTDIDEFDLDKMRYNIGSTNINGIRAQIYQRKPLVEPADVVADTATTQPPPAIDFDFGDLVLSDIQVDYRNDVTSLYSKLDLGKLNIESDDIDMKRQLVSLDEILLDNTTAAITMGKKEEAEIVKEEVKQEAKQQQESGWRIEVKKIALNNNNIAFSNNSEPKLKRGMDYAHLDAKQLTLHASDFIFSYDTIAARITKGQLTEQSGFVLNTLQTDFLYSSKKAYLHDLLIETPGTTLKRSAEISYPSLEALQKDIGRMQLNIDLQDSKIQVKDILTFAPDLAAQPAFADPNALLLLTGKIDGSVANMNIDILRLNAFGQTNVDLRGRITGLPDMNRLAGDLIITDISTGRGDIVMLAPKGSIPTNITIPESIKLKGRVSGNMRRAKGDLDLTTSLGNASIDGTIRNANNKQTATYAASLVASNLDLGAILKNDSLYGPVTATIQAAGKGFDMKTASANVIATINSVVLKRYNYKDIKLHADMASQKANFTVDINDPNIDLNIAGNSDFSGEFPTAKLNADVQNISTYNLHLTTDTLSYKGRINADFASTDPANPNGELYVTESILTTPAQRYPFDSISLTAGKTDTGKFVRFRSDVMSLALTGEYNLTELGSVFQQAIDPYYSIVDTVVNDTIAAYDFRFKAEVINGPLLKIFLPTLERMEPITMQGRFASGEGWNTAINAPLVVMGTNRVQDLKLNAGTANNAIRIRTNLEQLNVGNAMNIYATTLNADIADNKINFIFNLKDVNDKNKYRLGGRFEQPQKNNYTLVLNDDSLLLNYDRWRIAPANILKINNGYINIKDFTISRNNQRLSVSSAEETANSPMNIRLTDFRIATLTAFAKQDTALIDGIINGEATILNIATQPTFTSDLTINNLMLKKDTVGNLNLKVSNQEANVYAANITLTGYGNDVAINGNYHVKPANQSSINLVLDIRKLQMASVEAFSMGSISKGAGYVNGRFDIKGTFEKPDVNGKLNFNQVAFTPAMLGSSFTINNESITVNNRGINFSSFTILDSTKNKLVLDGNALTTNFINYQLDLDLTANDFQALSSTKQNSKLFYGQFYFDTDLHISGTEVSPRIDGNLKVNEKTKLTVVMPQTVPGVEDREGIIRFIDMDSVSMDTTLLLAQGDTVARSDVKGMDISLTIEVDKAAELTLIVDEANGDFLSMKGTARLSGGIDPSGKTTLTGSYEIEEGAYQISLNLLRRKFNIQKGSKITWLGEPTKADVDLTAVYVANTAPLTLVENQVENIQNLNIYKQKLPFNVKLMLTGELLKPTIQFDIVLPADNNYNVDASVIENVDTRLAQLKSEPSELNKQVFALLLLNRFVQENPFASSGEGGFNAGSMARQSVSKLLTEQLNNLAADLISGVDINFDVASTEDYTTGSMQNRTDLNVSLSKQLLNDRLRVTVGSNFELEGPQQTNQRSNNIAGNVALDYMLSKDGRYMLRAYRLNEYEGALEGYIIETGLNFILSFDYDHFHDLLRGKKKKEQKKTKTNTPAATDNRKAVHIKNPATN